MAEDKKSVIIYAEWYHTFEELTDEEAGRLIKHFFRYVNDKNPEAPDRVTKLLFQPIKMQLKRDLEKWETIKTKRSEAGKISADKRQQNQQVSTNVESVEQTPTNPTVNVDVNVNGNVNDIVKENKMVFDFSEEKSLYTNCIDLYNEFCLKTIGAGAKIDGAQGNAMKSIITYLKSQVKNKDDTEKEVYSTWYLILNNLHRCEKFYADQIKLNQINSNIVVIIKQIKEHGAGNKHKAANTSVVADLINEIGK